MLFEVLKDDSGVLRLEKVPGWRNNPACLELLNVKDEEEALMAAALMNSPVKRENTSAGDTQSGGFTAAAGLPEEPADKKAKRKNTQEV